MVGVSRAVYCLHSIDLRFSRLASTFLKRVSIPFNPSTQAKPKEMANISQVLLLQLKMASDDEDETSGFKYHETTDLQAG